MLSDKYIHRNGVQDERGNCGTAKVTGCDNSQPESRPVANRVGLSLSADQLVNQHSINPKIVLSQNCIDQPQGLMLPTRPLQSI